MAPVIGSLHSRPRGLQNLPKMPVLFRYCFTQCCCQRLETQGRGQGRHVPIFNTAKARTAPFYTRIF